MYKPLEVEVNGGVTWLQDGPETPEEAGCLSENISQAD